MYSVTPAVLGYLSVNTYRTCITLQTSAFIAFLVVSKVTTAHLIIESSRSFDRPINTRVPERPALAWHYCFLCLFLDFFSFLVHSVYLGYEPEGSTFQYYYFLFLLDYAIRTLSTLPRTWAPLRGTYWTEHHNSNSTTVYSIHCTLTLVLYCVQTVQCVGLSTRASNRCRGQMYPPLRHSLAPRLLWIVLNTYCTLKNRNRNY